MKSLSLLSFSDLLDLPVSLPRFVIFVTLAIIVIFGIFCYICEAPFPTLFSDLVYLLVLLP